VESRDLTKKEPVKLSDSAYKEILEKCSGRLYQLEGEDTGVIFVPKELREKYGVRAVKVRVKGKEWTIEGGVK